MTQRRISPQGFLAFASKINLRVWASVCARVSGFDISELTNAFMRPEEPRHDITDGKIVGAACRPGHLDTDTDAAVLAAEWPRLGD